jgi:hypothetical protein
MLPLFETNSIGHAVLCCDSRNSFVLRFALAVAYLKTISSSNRLFFGAALLPTFTDQPFAIVPNFSRAPACRSTTHYAPTIILLTPQWAGSYNIFGPPAGYQKLNCGINGKTADQELLTTQKDFTAACGTNSRADIHRSVNLLPDSKQSPTPTTTY